MFVVKLVSVAEQLMGAVLRGGAAKTGAWVTAFSRDQGLCYTRQNAALNHWATGGNRFNLRDSRSSKHRQILRWGRIEPLQCHGTGGHGGHALEHGVGRGQGQARRNIYLRSDPLRTGETRKRRNGRQKAKKDKIGSNF